MEFVSSRDKEEIQRITDAYLAAHSPTVYVAVAGISRSDLTVLKADEITTEKDLKHLSKYLYIKEGKEEYLLSDWFTKKMKDGIFQPHFITTNYLYNLILGLTSFFNLGYRIDEKYYDSLYPEKEPQSFF